VIKHFLKLIFIAITISLVAILFMSESQLPNTTDASRQARPQMGSVASSVLFPLQRPAAHSTLSDIASPQSALEEANAYLSAHRAEWHIQKYHELRPRLTTTPLGSTIRYDVFQSGVPVLGIPIILHVDLTGKINADLYYRPIGEVNISNPSVMTSEDVLNTVADKFSEDPAVGSNPSKVIIANQASSGDLAYAVPVLDKESGNTPVEVFLRASDGQILRKVRGRGEFGR